MSLGLLVLSSESNACSPLLNLGITKRLVVTKLLIIFEWDPHFYFVVLFAVLFCCHFFHICAFQKFLCESSEPFFILNTHHALRVFSKEVGPTDPFITYTRTFEFCLLPEPMLLAFSLG